MIRFGSGLLLALLLLLPIRLVAGESRSAAPFLPAVGVGRLTSPELAEASGLASSRLRQKVFWLVNDSGSDPVLHAINLQGAALGSVRVAGVKNVDWEDLASFVWQGRSWLLVADTGDNLARRDEVVLHLVPEPEAQNGRYAGSVRPHWSLRFRYPGGPRDCEAVAVDVPRGEILLLSKRNQPAVLYSLPLQAPMPSAGPVKARKVTAVEILPVATDSHLLELFGSFQTQPTAMDISADGLAAVVLTYQDAYLYRRQPRESWATAMQRQPQRIVLPGLDYLPQREALCFTADGSGLLVTSEGEGAGLFLLGPKTKPKGPERRD